MECMKGTQSYKYVSPLLIERTKRQCIHDHVHVFRESNEFISNSLQAKIK